MGREAKPVARKDQMNVISSVLVLASLIQPLKDIRSPYDKLLPQAAAFISSGRAGLNVSLVLSLSLSPACLRVNGSI